MIEFSEKNARARARGAWASEGYTAQNTRYVNKDGEHCFAYVENRGETCRAALVAL